MDNKTKIIKDKIEDMKEEPKKEEKKEVKEIKKETKDEIKETKKELKDKHYLCFQPEEAGSMKKETYIKLKLPHAPEEGESRTAVKYNHEEYEVHIKDGCCYIDQRDKLAIIALEKQGFIKVIEEK